MATLRVSFSPTSMRVCVMWIFIRSRNSCAKEFRFSLRSGISRSSICAGNVYFVQYQETATETRGELNGKVENVHLLRFCSRQYRTENAREKKSVLEKSRQCSGIRIFLGAVQSTYIHMKKYPSVACATVVSDPWPVSEHFHNDWQPTGWPMIAARCVRVYN